MNPTHDESNQNATSPDVTTQGRGARGRWRMHEEGMRRRLDFERIREVGRNLSGQVEEQVHHRPFVAIGAALGIGFAAGSLFGSRFGQMLLAVGVGYALRNLAGDMTADRIQAGLERLRGDSIA